MPFELVAGWQLQAIQGRCAEERLADDQRTQRAVRPVDDIVRTQQYIYRTAGRPVVGAVAADHAKLGLHRFRVEQLAADEVALADEARDEGGQRFVIEVERRVPLLEAAVLEHAT